MLKNVVSHSVATALASIVFPVPGGPNSSTPFHGCSKPVNSCGYLTGMTTASFRMRFGASSSTTSDHRTLGLSVKISLRRNPPRHEAVCPRPWAAHGGRSPHLAIDCASLRISGSLRKGSAFTTLCAHSISRRAHTRRAQRCPAHRTALHSTPPPPPRRPPPRQRPGPAVPPSAGRRFARPCPARTPGPAPAARPGVARSEHPRPAPPEGGAETKREEGVSAAHPRDQASGARTRLVRPWPPTPRSGAPSGATASSVSRPPPALRSLREPLEEAAGGWGVRGARAGPTARRPHLRPPPGRRRLAGASLQEASAACPGQSVEGGAVRCRPRALACGPRPPPRRPSCARPPAASKT